MTLAELRKEYALAGLRRKDLDADPLAQFHKWFEEAISAQVLEPNAMTLATSDLKGRPSTRIVLLKGLDARGFQFFTNYHSRKGRELAENPNASLNLYWRELERQVCIIGTVSKTSREEAEVYFRSRPLGSRRAAWASKQSQVIPDRAWLENSLETVIKKHPAEEIPTPPHWGGYVLAPTEIEFWQGGMSRLHDRFRYRKNLEVWAIELLSR